MNLDLTWLGWAHSLACLVALALGAATFFQRKGSPAHVGLGRAYLLSMLVVNLTAFGIYRRHMFWFPHWFAVAALACIGLGYAAARLKQPRGLRLRLHLSGMIASYYVLVGGGVNEIYLRVDALRGLALARHGAAVGLTHLVVLTAFVTLIAAMNARLPAQRAPAASAASAA